jgi:hypothetical protein
MKILNSITISFLLCQGCNKQNSKSDDLTCDQVNAGAANAALVLIENAQECEEDIDCEIIQVNGNCFDVCTRAVQADKIEELNEQFEQINTEWCEQGEDCFFEIPPCAPPGAPQCVEGVCVE